jgi:hypothetical protein
MIIEQTIVISANRRFSITTDTTRDDDAGLQVAFDTRFAGAVSPALSGKGKINGDIIGPFYEEWEE